MMQEVWLGDSLELLKRIGDEAVDMVITDPPYSIDYADWDVLHTNTNSALGGSSPAQNKSSFKRRGKPINGWSSSDKNIGKEYQEWCAKWLVEIHRIVKPASPILIFNSRRFYHRLCVAAEDSELLVKDMLIWKKNKANGKAQDINKVPRMILENLNIPNYRIGNLKPMFEPILYAIKPYQKTITDCVIKDKVGGFFSLNKDIKSNIFAYDTESGLHIAQKPVKLIEDLILTFSFDEQTILDPFAGSGTTLLAAKNLGRQFIGIEQEQESYDIILKRLQV